MYMCISPAPDEEREALKVELLDFISRFLRLVELELNFDFNRHGKIRDQIKGTGPYLLNYMYIHVLYMSWV